MAESAKTRWGCIILVSLVAFLVACVFFLMTPVRDSRCVMAIPMLKDYLEQYANNFDRKYPPSHVEGMTGAQALYYYLMGPNEKGWGPESDRGGVPAKFAWDPPRISADWIGGGPGTPIARKYFTDDLKGKRAILYYRADRSPLNPGGTPRQPREKYTDIYDMTDNNDVGGTGVFWTPKPEDWRELIVNPASGDKESPYSARTYIIISAGEDRVFGFVRGKCDDFVNFNRP